MSRVKGKCIVTRCNNRQASRGVHNGHKCYKRLCRKHEGTTQGLKAIRAKPKKGTPKHLTQLPTTQSLPKE